MQITFQKAICQLYKTWRSNGHLEAHVAIADDQYIVFELTQSNATVHLHQLDEPISHEPVPNLEG